MSFNTLITQTISCFEDVLKLLSKVSDEPYLVSVVSNLIEEWRQHADGCEAKHKRQMSDHVVCSKKSYEDTLQRLRRSSNLESKSIRKSEEKSSIHLTIPSENAPSLPPRNNITRGVALKERKSPSRHNLLKSSNSTTELELVPKPSDPPRRIYTPEMKSDCLLSTYDSLVKVRTKCPTPEIGFRPESPLTVSKNSLENSLESEFLNSPILKNTKSCSDLLGKADEDSVGESTLLSTSLRSSYVKFKPKNGKWAKMYLTHIGKNIYVSRNYADDQTEFVYSLKDFEIVPKDDGRSKFLIFLKTGDVTQCSISMKSCDVRDDWYKAMIRSKYKPKTKSSGSLDLSPVEGEKLTRSREAIYISPNNVIANAARDLGIRVLINDEKYDTLGRKKVSKEGENGVKSDAKLDSSGDEYVVNDWDDVADGNTETPYLSLLNSPVQNAISCSLAFGQTAPVCDENMRFYLQN